MRTKGFTLAEVLITLSIIGIIAAITLSSLVNSYKKQQTIAQLKKVYTNLNQALKLAESEYGPYEYWEIPAINSNVKSYYNKYWYPYFKILKSCENYSQCNYTSNQPWYYPNGSKSTLTFNSQILRIPFLLTDGTLISISIAGGDILTKESQIYIDLNGSKLPNKYGIDVFVLNRVKGKGILAYGQELSIDEIKEECSYSGKGETCAARIIYDGWQIKNDYPW